MLALYASQANPVIERVANVVVTIAVLGSAAALIGFGELGARRTPRRRAPRRVRPACDREGRGSGRPHEGAVTMHTMFGVLCIYPARHALLLRLRLGGRRRIDAFFASGIDADISDYLYFSFATMTTVGYGDLVAATDVGRSVAIAEALIGQIYLVTVVAVIVAASAGAGIGLSGAQGIPLDGQRPDQAANRPRPGEPHGGRHPGQRSTDLRMDRKGSRGRRAAGGVSRADGHGLTGRGPVAEATLPRRRPPAVDELASEVGAIVALVGFPEPAPGGDFRHPQRRRRPRGRPPERRLPQDPPSELRRLRRAALLHPRRPSRRRSRSPGPRVGLTICEDFWADGPAGFERGGGRREADRESLRVALPPRPGPQSRADGAGRARYYGARFAFCNLVGGQDELVFDGHSFVVDPERGGARPRARSSRRSCWSARSPAPWPAESRRAAPESPRSTPPSISACATTSRRTASATSAWPSRAGSTPPSSPCSPPMRSGPSASPAWSCPRPIPALKHRSDARTIAANLGAELIEIPIEAAMDEYERPSPRARWPAAATAASRCRGHGRPWSPTWPPRTSRRGSAAT